MSDRYLSPLDRVKRANSPTAMDEWNECVARWEEKQAEREAFEPLSELKKTGTGGWL